MSNLSIHSEYVGPDNLAVGNGKKLAISHVGSSSHISHGHRVHLQNILHVPSISQNLLFVSQFTKDNNCHFVFTSSGFYVKEKKTGKILFQGRITNGLYPLQLSSCLHNKLPSSPSAFSTRVSHSLWHHRLGHPTRQAFQRVAPTLSLSGPTSLPHVCIACQMEKRSKLLFQSSISVTSSPLEIIHTDVWGYSPMSTVNGCRFYITFIDDFSRYCWFFPIQFKSQVFDVFLEFKPLVENMFDRRIKTIQSDGGGEYTSNRFKKMLIQNGISHRISCPPTPEQNGLAERKHRHIVETGLTLLAHSRVPLSFWDAAFDTTVFLINRMPSSALNYRSPYKKLFHVAPDYTIMRSFGCACFPYIRPYNATKLSFRTIPCVVLGYGRNYKGYKCYDPVSKRIYMGRHVVFDENVYPLDANLQTKHLNSTQPDERILLGNFTPSIVPTLPSARLQPTINTTT